MNIYNYRICDLEEYFDAISENKAKAKILFKSLYKDKIREFDEITTMGDKIKNKLKNNFNIYHIKEISRVESNDTTKLLFQLDDGNTIETVIMKHNYGNGVCISTQIGCNMGCIFCESGKLKKIRNLLPYEMVQQILYVRDVLNIQISHIVLMGIGEPFDNYDNVMKFIDIVSDQSGIAIASKHITISTCGISDKIIEFSKREVVNSLAISLHAPTDELRNQIMPINKRYPIDTVISAVKEYIKNGNKKITFAYIMIKDINDSDECAYRLAELVNGIKCIINIIPYNKTRSSVLKQSEKDRIKAFFDILKQNGLNVTVRREFGSELNAACGQLSSDYINAQ